jgi:prepilin-type processing-associated H-X9-DG protein
VALKATSTPSNFYLGNPDVAAPFYVGGDPTIQTSYSPTYEWPSGENRHNNGGNVAYCDGHAKYLTAAVLAAWDATDLRMWNNVQ